MERIKITIPTTVEVDESRIEGDWTHPATYEIHPNSPYAEIYLPPYEQMALNNGSRVFTTQDGLYLILHPEPKE